MRMPSNVANNDNNSDETKTPMMRLPCCRTPASLCRPYWDLPHLCTFPSFEVIIAIISDDSSSSSTKISLSYPYSTIIIITHQQHHHRPPLAIVFFRALIRHDHDAPHIATQEWNLVIYKNNITVFWFLKHINILLSVPDALCLWTARTWDSDPSHCWI